MNNKKLAVWLPLIIALSIAAGIFVGNQYKNLSGGKIKNYSGGNKINAILDIIDDQYVDTVNMKNLVESTIPKIFSELDPHTTYIPAEYAKAENERMEGSFSGIGIMFNMLTDTVVVINVTPGGPSEKAGILPGDRIVSINDSVYVGKERQEDIMKTLRGAKNSTVKLGIQRMGEPALIYFDVTRDDIPVSPIEVAYEVEKGIGLIKVKEFTRPTYNDFITAIAKLKEKGVKAYIIDLRGNLGGYMDAAINMANEFLPEGRLIVYTEGKAFPRNDVFANGTGTCKDAPLVVLTDDSSASASEIFAGAIQDNDRGLVIGRRTFGKGLVQVPIKLSDGSSIHLTIARYYTPSGRSIQKKYELGKSDEYDQDFINRLMHGEMDSKDSIKLDKSLQYQTTLGRTVYGGGGIMPDIFIPRDTTGYTSYYSNVYYNGLLHQYAFKYVDDNRQKLAAYKNAPQLYAYLKTQPLVTDFTNFAASKGIKKRPTLISVSRNLIETQLYTLIVNYLFDNEGSYPILFENDPAVKKAVEVIKSGSTFPASPAQ